MHKQRVGQVGHSIETERFRLIFVWTGDRWTHLLEIAGITLARPVEVEPEWKNPELVISPTYQQLNFQAGSLVETQQALLVGQAGPHHFSAVFTVSESDEASVVEVDVADRSRSPLNAFAATYTIAKTSSDLIDANDAFVEWMVGSQRVRFESGLDCQIGLAEAGRSATRVQATASIHPEQKTQRCRYRWVLK